jgi:Rha family phage regulatory protein
MANELISVQNKNGQLVVTSREIANNFKKQHSSVLKSIQGETRKGKHVKGLYEQIESSGNPRDYFIPTLYVDSKGREYTEYLLTRDGFTLVAMGFTGEIALQFKIEYINKFNEMEQCLKNNSNKLNEVQNTINTVQPQDVLQLAQGMQMIGQVVAGIQQTVNNVENFVKDSIVVKDKQIDDTRDMIGLRARNTMMLTQTLKDKLSDLTGRKIYANNQLYINNKNRVFKNFHVIRWEDIPIDKFNAVFAYIDSLEEDEIHNN